MASDLHFVEYVCDRIGAAGRVSFRQMFGEYAIYCDGEVVALVCDDQFFLEPTAAGRALLGRVSPRRRPILAPDRTGSSAGRSRTRA